MREMKVSIHEHLTAKQRADKAYRERLVARGRCIRCRKPREGEAQRCRRCTAAAADAAWRRRQGEPQRPHGPTPTRGGAGWNFDTDDLIAAHVTLAKALAWQVRAQVPLFGVDVDDMVGDALYGLVVAGRTYDASYNVPFKAWATKQIRGAVYDGLRRWTHGHQKEPPKFVPLSGLEVA